MHPTHNFSSTVPKQYNPNMFVPFNMGNLNPMYPFSHYATSVFPLSHPALLYQNQACHSFTYKAGFSPPTKLEHAVKTESEDLESLYNQKVEDIPYSQAETCSSSIKLEVKTETESSFRILANSEICLEAQTRSMVQFFVNNYGIITEEEITEARPRYANHQKLLDIFDALYGRYSTTGKTREEMVKWIIRRSLKVTKQLLKKNQKKDQKSALRDLCKRYFTNSDKSVKQEELDDDFVDKVLPFRKNSRNKTINTSFIMELFKSEEFKTDYNGFLGEFDQIIEKENIDKIAKFTKLLMECSRKGNFKPIFKYRRIPWLKLWMQNTKKIAQDLEEEELDEKSSKKIKSDS